MYLDHNATSLISEETVRIVNESMAELIGKSGNPSSTHRAGKTARNILDRSIHDIKTSLDCKPSDEVIFTSGATEGINMAIVGSTMCFVRMAKEIGKNGVFPHIITSSIEHPATLASCEFCKMMFNAEISTIKVDEDGIIDIEEVKKSLIPGRTCCVSFVHGSNEVGTIQYNISEIFDIVRKRCPLGSYSYLVRYSSTSSPLNKNGLIKENDDTFHKQFEYPRFPLCHLDCTQTVGKTLFSFTNTNSDCISFAGHKLCGIGGIGCVLLRDKTFINGEELPPRTDGMAWPGIVVCSTPVDDILHGSLQQGGRRPGTEPVLLANILGRAVKNIYNNITDDKLQSCSRIALKLYKSLSATLRNYGILARLNGSIGKIYSVACEEDIEKCLRYSGILFLPNTLSVTIINPRNDNLKPFIARDVVEYCSSIGVAMLSSGSACSNLEAQLTHGSTVLKSLGFSDEEANSTLRISLPLDLSDESDYVKVGEKIGKAIIELYIK